MTSVVDRLNETLHGVLASLLSPGQNCALLDVPATANWGDHAIWMGEREALAAVGVQLGVRGRRRAFDPSAMRRQLGRDGVGLLHGGGSLGDLYPPRQRLREMVLRTIRDFPVVQLPQSIHSATTPPNGYVRDLVRGHPARRGLSLHVGAYPGKVPGCAQPIGDGAPAQVYVVNSNVYGADNRGGAALTAAAARAARNAHSGSVVTVLKRGRHKASNPHVVVLAYSDGDLSTACTPRIKSTYGAPQSQCLRRAR